MTTGKLCTLFCLSTLIGRASTFLVGKLVHTRCVEKTFQHRAVTFPAGPARWQLASTLEAPDLSTARLKGKLLKQVAGINRGLSCREEEQKEILALVEQLETHNPNTSPNDGFADGSSVLTGEWKLIFTSALDVLSLGLIPGVDVGQVFQNINEDGTEITNIVDLQPGFSPVFGRFAGETSARLKLPGAGWVDTTYVDEDLRVARAFGGNLFVLARA